jgi:hypothetical protein
MKSFVRKRICERNAKPAGSNPVCWRYAAPGFEDWQGGFLAAAQRFGGDAAQKIA